jgi:hypothetical protein
MNISKILIRICEIFDNRKAKTVIYYVINTIFNSAAESEMVCKYMC